MSDKKPPLGVKPIWLVAEERIKDLSEAITRLIASDETHYLKLNKTKDYAEEIKVFCKLAQEAPTAQDLFEEELPF